MSTIRLPTGSAIGSPAPTAAITGCCTRYTSLALEHASLTARRSTGVISLGTPITMRGCTTRLYRCALCMKWFSMCEVASKSAITPFFIGRMAVIRSGVRPIISRASVPTASTPLESLRIATIDGSFTTMPLLRSNTSVLAVPRSIARSEENMRKSDAVVISCADVSI